MFNHLLIFLALISFSVVSHAAAIPMDADQAVLGATPNAVMHKDVAVIQGGDADRDVADIHAVLVVDSCPADMVCVSTDASVVNVNSPTTNDWFVVQDSASALQPVAVLLMIIGLIVFFLSRKSTSTK